MAETCNLDMAADALKNNLLSKNRRKPTQRPTRHPAKSPEQPEQPEQGVQSIDIKESNQDGNAGIVDFEPGTPGTATPPPKPLRPFFMMVKRVGKELSAISSEQELVDLMQGLWRDKQPGLYYVPIVQEAQQITNGKTTKKVTALKPGELVWVSKPFDVLASTDDGQGHGHGTAIRFESIHGHLHTWTLPRALLVTEGRELFQKLYEMGFHMAVRSNGDSFHRLREYLNRARSENKDMPKALSVSRTGWAPGRRFVLPDVIFGGDGTTLYYQSDDPKPSPYTQAGSFDGWREGVCKPLTLYDLLVFVMSCAFAGPLLEPLRIESGGFHLEGLTSTGKTSAIRLALSAWGNPNDLTQTWNGTRVGVELVTAAFSDTLLALDEIGQADPRTIGEIVYMVCNENGKTRGNVRLTHRANLRWRALLLSSGEKSLAQIMASANNGLPPAAGQETRLAHLPVDVDGCGIFNGLTDLAQRKALLSSLTKAAKANYGYAARAFLHRLTDPKMGTDPDDYAATVKAMANVLAGSDATNEIDRVALRFALVGFAGEIATSWGITGWPDGRAEDAASAMFKRWRAHWGTANRDETLFLLRCDEWLAEHQMGAFIEVDPIDRKVLDARRTTNIKPFYGYVSLHNEQRKFFLNAAGWRELTRQSGRGVALSALKRTQRLDAGGDGDGGRKMRINGESSRYYVVV